jgi:LPS export ABC transporter protein LptC
MEARNNVVVTNSKGETLNTEQLMWDERSEKLYSDVFVKITTPDQIIFGEGFESNQNFTQYRINKIKGTIKVKNNPVDGK